MEKNEKIKKKSAVIIAVSVILLLAITVALYIILRKDSENNTGDVARTTLTEGEGELGTRVYETPDEALDDFFAANRLYIEGRVETADDEGTADSPRSILLWRSGDMLRIDYDIESEHYRTLIIKDGTPTLFLHENRTSLTAVIPPDFYTQMLGRQPVTDMQYLGEDDVFQGSKYLLPVDRFYDSEGYAKSYYVRDLTFCINETGILYIRSAGNTPANGEKPTMFKTLTMVFERTNLNAQFDDTVFDSPF